MGGEKSVGPEERPGVQGSPPHGRGKVEKRISEYQEARITPAWAGKSRLGIPRRGCAVDHPRMGGEKLIFVHLLDYTTGSPPHGRGKDSVMDSLQCVHGITPAWAGKRLHLFFCFGQAEDHPRMGGEKHIANFDDESGKGSPPHGRGKEEGLSPFLVSFRITPAWAGKRLKRSHRSGIFISGPIPFHSVLHRPAGPGGSRAGRDGSPAGQPQNAGPA